MRLFSIGTWQVHCNEHPTCLPELLGLNEISVVTAYDVYFAYLLGRCSDLQGYKSRIVFICYKNTALLCPSTSSIPELGPKNPSRCKMY